MAASAIAPRAVELPGEGPPPSRRLSLFKPKTWVGGFGKGSASNGSSSNSSRRSSKDHNADASAGQEPSDEVGEPSSTTDAAAEASGSPTSSPIKLSRDLIAKPDADGRISFFHRGADNFWLSNSSDHAVSVDDVRYPTAEHLFQACKFLGHRPEVAQKIRKTSNPIDAIKVARKHSTEVKAGWIKEGLNVQAMRQVLLLKFTQHSQLRLALLETGDAELVNASPTDAFWGATGNGRGRNELGKAIEMVRETIRGASGLGIGSGAKTV